MKRLSALVFCIILLASLPSTARAHHREKVLGEATAAADIIIPPVTSGTGLILPDSPFYFLDQGKQRVKLLLATGADKKAKIHNEIAGERLAELRVMMQRDDTDGITTALNQLAREHQLAAEKLSDAASAGKDVKDLAKELNTTIKQRREILNTAADQANGDLEMKFLLASSGLKEAKLEVEDNLPEDEFQKEVEEGLEEEIEHDLDTADGTSKRLLRSLEVLEEQASRAAQANNEKRLAALRRAIENKNETLKRLEERQIELEQKRQEKLSEEREVASDEVKEASENLQKAIVEYKKAAARVKEIKTADVEKLEAIEEIKPTSTPRKTTGAESEESTED